MPKEQKVYHAAELFHLPARVFNERVVDALEENGINVFSPQRDGFEFTHLARALQKDLTPELVGHAMQTIIYAYDIVAISKSDVVVARFDEPPDPGVDTEVLIANALGIPVVTYRTDVRSPYGNSSGKYSGMHSFPIKTSAILIVQTSSSKTEEDLALLTDSIVREVKNFPLAEERTVPKFLRKTFKIAHLLFDGIEDIHSDKGLKQLAQRCLKYKDKLIYFGPKALRI